MIYYPLYPSKYYLLLVLKICKPPDLFLGLKCLVEIQGTAPKTQHQRCACCIPFTWLLGSPASPLHTHPGHLHIPVPFVLWCQVIPLPKEATSRSHCIYLMPHMLSYLLCMTFISFDLFIISRYVFLSLIFSSFIWLCNPVC